MIKLHIDAAFRQKTHETGIGIYIQQNSKNYRVKYYISYLHDNHLAEFMALLLGLEAIQTLGLQDSLLIIHSDSQIVVNSVEKEYAKRDEYYGPLTAILKQLKEYSNYFIQWKSDRDGKIADQLSRDALHKTPDTIERKPEDFNRAFYQW